MGIFERLSAAGSAFLGEGKRTDLAAAMESGLEPKAAAGGELQRVSEDSGWLIRAINGGRTDAGVTVTQLSALTLPVVYACVSIISENLAQLPLNVFKRRPDGRGSDLAYDHPLQLLLHDEPNEYMTSFVWRQTQQSHALLWGNGYAEIERTVGGRPVGIWPLYPDRTDPHKEANRPLEYRSTINGSSVRLNPADVLHIPALGFDGIRGYSPVYIARQSVGWGLAMERFGAKFFANDSKSGGFLMHPGKLGDTGKKNVADSFMDQGKNADGERDNFRVKVLEEGMKFVTTTIPPDDAQFLGSREFQVAEIARMFRVPLVLLQSMEKSTSWGSGIEQQMIGFVVWTIQPWLVRWEQELARKLLTQAERAAGYFVKFNVNALLRGDMKARSSFYKTMREIEAMSPNEVRGYEDLNPYEGGDEFDAPSYAGGAAGDAAEDPADPNDPNSNDGGDGNAS